MRGVEHVACMGRGGIDTGFLSVNLKEKAHLENSNKTRQKQNGSY
jgi:hypothetical protein